MNKTALIIKWALDIELIRRNVNIQQKLLEAGNVHLSLARRQKAMDDANNSHDGATLKAVTISIGTTKPLPMNTAQEQIIGPIPAVIRQLPLEFTMNYFSSFIKLLPNQLLGLPQHLPIEDMRGLFQYCSFAER